MPFREEEELDSVTLHNLAVVNIDDDPNDSNKKLNFVVKNEPCPPEALANLLILYCKYGQFDLAHDVLSENEDLKQRYLSDDDISYISALSLINSSKEAAFESLDRLGKLYRDNLTKQQKLLLESEEGLKDNNNEMTEKIVQEYEKAMQKYLPVLTAQAKIFWDMGNYEAVEQILLSNDNSEYFADNISWRINMGHSLFIQETSFDQAMVHYWYVYSSNTDILQIPATVIANLCVCLIMIQRNDEAQEIMRRVEEEELKAAEMDPKRQLFHICIVNLIVGTLYAAKNNYEFGISRIIIAFKHFKSKMNMDTWMYTKRVFLSLIENLAKQILVMPDDLYLQIIHFLDDADKKGKTITTQMTEKEVDEKFTVSSEARLIKRMFLKLKEFATNSQ